MNDHINLYISERRAFEAAQRELAKANRPLTMRVLSAVTRCADGSIDRGFKVLMVPPRDIGQPYYI